MIDTDCLPNLLIIGAAKSGTTSLHEYLNQHPDIFMSRPKEPRFFLVWDNPEQIRQNVEHKQPKFNAYDTIEKYCSLFEKGRNAKIRGESSPQYLLYPHCAEKIKKLIPEVKIVAVLRHPADRAFSQYQMHKKWGIEAKSFDEVLEEETNGFRRSYPLDMQYLESGKYGKQLEVYFKTFNRNQLQLFFYEDFQVNPSAIFKKIFQFLQVDDGFIPDRSLEHNVSKIARYSKGSSIDRSLSVVQKIFRRLKIHSIADDINDYRFYKPGLSSCIREKIGSYFDEDISTLELLFDVDLSSWKYDHFRHS